MHKVEVGELLVPGVTSWPEGGQFNWDAGGADLVLRLARPTRAEVEGVRAGPCGFALKVEGDVLFFLYTFRGLPWSDAPYTWHLLPEGLRGIPPAQDTGETRLPLHVTLVNAATGVVGALRVVTLSPGFTRALLGAVRVQASTPWCGREEYDRQLGAAYRKYPTTAALLAAASCRTAGGA
jgi:hypothetical protein